MIGSNPLSPGEHAQPMSEINTTPLVDVMLVLLVIFIITAPILTHTVKIELPQATSQPLLDKPEVISVSINEVGQLFWNDTQLVNGELLQKLTQVADQKPQPELQIRADKATRYQVLAEVMAEAQNTGITKIGFVSEPKVSE
ncbi:MAG: biopolymer transport protein ExbD [Methylophilaceae bacterium]|jgi:biopolymer transport protein ExbD